MAALDATSSTAGAVVTLQQAKEDKFWWPLMNFLISWGRHIDNWKDVQARNLVPQTPTKLYRGLSWSPGFKNPDPYFCQNPAHGDKCECQGLRVVHKIPEIMPSFYTTPVGGQLCFDEIRCTSWTTDIDIAEDFAKAGPGGVGLIIACEFTPQQMVISTEYLEQSFRLQREIIIAPQCFHATIKRTYKGVRPS